MFKFFLLNFIVFSTFLSSFSINTLAYFDNFFETADYSSWGSQDSYNWLGDWNNNFDYQTDNDVSNYSIFGASDVYQDNSISTQDSFNWSEDVSTDWNSIWDNNWSSSSFDTTISSNDAFWYDLGYSNYSNFSDFNWNNYYNNALYSDDYSQWHSQDNWLAYNQGAEISDNTTNSDFFDTNSPYSQVDNDYGYNMLSIRYIGQHKKNIRRSFSLTGNELKKGCPKTFTNHKYSVFISGGYAYCFTVDSKGKVIPTSKGGKKVRVNSYYINCKSAFIKRGLHNTQMSQKEREKNDYPKFTLSISGKCSYKTSK